MPGVGDFFVGAPDEPDKYRLVHQVGAGGEAQLWKAELNVSGQWEPVAVKILRADRHGDIEQWKTRWAEQAEVLRFIRHPGVVGVREHFEGGAMHYAGESPPGLSSLYLVMNWVDGVPLRDWVPLHREADQHFEAIRYLAQVGDVLDWLHSGQATPSGRPVIHADVSPSNVLVTAAGQAVLVDFGLTRLAGGTSPVVEGTRGYMAPEVLTAGLYSPASDRYSFAALTYFVLTGQNPPLDLAAIQAGLAQLPIVSTQPGLIGHLMQMFLPDPSARPAAGDWIRFFRVSGTTSLGSSAGLQPTVPVAAPPSATGREGSRRRRSTWIVATAAVLFALLAGGIALAVGRNPGSPHADSPPHRPKVSGVTATDPPPNTSTSATTTIPPSTTTTALPPQNGLSPFFLADASTCCGSSSSPKTGAATINGQTFPHSIWTDAFDSCYTSNTPVTFNYDLGRQYSTFTATIGDTDTSALQQPIQFDVYLDTTNHAYTQSVEVGQSVPISIPVAHVLTLTLTMTQLPTQNQQNCSTVDAAWGDARVSP